MSQHYIKNDLHRHADVVTVTARENDQVSFRMIGGGLVHTMPGAEFDATHRVVTADELATMAAANTRGAVTGDWLDGATIPAWISARTWNGFANPAFERADVEAAIADGRFDNLFAMPDQDAYVAFQFDGDNRALPPFDRAAVVAALREKDQYELETDGGTYTFDKYAAIEIATEDGPRTVYPIGSDGWTWQNAEDAMPAPPVP